MITILKTVVVLTAFIILPVAIFTAQWRRQHRLTPLARWQFQSWTFGVALGGGGLFGSPGPLFAIVAGCLLATFYVVLLPGAIYARSERLRNFGRLITTALPRKKRDGLKSQKALATGAAMSSFAHVVTNVGLLFGCHLICLHMNGTPRGRFIGITMMSWFAAWCVVLLGATIAQRAVLDYVMRLYGRTSGRLDQDIQFLRGLAAKSRSRSEGNAKLIGG